MIIVLNEDEMASAVGGIKEWLQNSGGVNPGTLTSTGEDPAWKAAYKLLKEHGAGEYEVKEDGKLFKGEELIVHCDDVNAFAMDPEFKVKVEFFKAADPEEDLPKFEMKSDKKKKK